MNENNVIDMVAAQSNSSAVEYKIGDSLKVFAGRNNLELSSQDTYAAWKVAIKEAYNARLIAIKDIRPVKLTERASYNVKAKLWMRNTIATYQQVASVVDAELVAAAIEKTTSQNAKRLADMTGASMSLAAE